MQSAQQSLPWISAGFPKPLPYTLTSGVAFQNATVASAQSGAVLVGSGPNAVHNAEVRSMQLCCQVAARVGLNNRTAWQTFFRV